MNKNEANHNWINSEFIIFITKTQITFMHVSLYFTSQEPTKHKNISNQCIHYLKKYKSDSDTNICICCYCFNCSTSKERQKSTTDYCLTGGGKTNDRECHW